MSGLLIVLTALLAADPGAVASQELPPLPVDDLLFPSEVCGTPSAAEVTHVDLLYDLGILELLLRQGYAGFEPLADQGLDWDALFADMRAGVEELPDPVPVARVQDWVLRFLEATGDNHLALWRIGEQGWWTWRSAGRHHDAWVAEVALRPDGQGRWVDGGGARIEGCEGTDATALLQPVFDGEDPLALAWRPLVLSVAEPPPLHCEFEGEDQVRRLPLRRLRGFDQDLPHQPAWEPILQEPLFGIRLRTLAREQEPELLAFVETAGQLRAAPAVLLDVRGNPGGSDNPVMELFSGLTDQPLRYDDIEQLDSSVALLGDIQGLRCDLARDKAAPELQDEWARELEALQAKLDVWRAEGAEPWRRWEHHTLTTEGLAAEPWRGRLVVLTDRGCASSCETVPLLARQLPGSLVVGENTGGVGVFGEVKSFRLPRSGLGLGLGSKYFHHLDPALDIEEGVGYLPDLWLDSPDPVTAATAVATCLADPACSSEFDVLLGSPRGNDRPVARHDPPRPDIRPLVDPASLSADSAVLARIIERAVDSRSDALVILVDGTPLVSWPEDQLPIETMSATKSILNLAIGKLIDEGVIPSVDTPVSTWFPSWAEGDKARVTVRYLLEHSSGLAAPPSREIYASGDLLGFALGSELVTEPGKNWAYNNNAANLLAGIVSAAAGEPLDTYIGRHFMEPMGIHEWSWDQDPKGNFQGGAGLALRAEDLARFGTLMLDGGAWHGEQLISQDWVERSTQPGPLLPGCGRLWWMFEDGDASVIGYRADGWLGQVLAVIPGKRVVAVRQMRSRPEHWKYGDEGVDTFRDFLSRIRELVP